MVYRPPVITICNFVKSRISEQNTHNNQLTPFLQNIIARGHFLEKIFSIETYSTKFTNYLDNQYLFQSWDQTPRF